MAKPAVKAEEQDRFLLALDQDVTISVSPKSEGRPSRLEVDGLDAVRERIG